MKHPKRIVLIALGGTFMCTSFLLNTDKELAESMKRGEEVYKANCMACHQENGTGLEGAFPPLAKSDYLMADTPRAIKLIKEGMEGELYVNGQPYYGFMPAQDLSEQQLADVMNYIRNSWGNTGKIVRVEEVKTALQ